MTLIESLVFLFLHNLELLVIMREVQIVIGDRPREKVGEMYL